MKNNARYTITTITTIDEKLKSRYLTLKQLGFTHEAIYRRGIESIEQEHIKDLTQNNVA